MRNNTELEIHLEMERYKIKIILEERISPPIKAGSEAHHKIVKKALSELRRSPDQETFSVVRDCILSLPGDVKIKKRGGELFHWNSIRNL